MPLAQTSPTAEATAARTDGTAIPRPISNDDELSDLALALTSLTVAEEDNGPKPKSSTTDSDTLHSQSTGLSTSNAVQGDSEASAEGSDLSSSTGTLSAPSNVNSVAGRKAEVKLLRTAKQERLEAGEPDEELAQDVQNLTRSDEEIDLTGADDGPPEVDRNIPSFSAANIPTAFLERLDADNPSARQVKYARAARKWPGPRKLPILHIDNIPVTRKQIAELLRRASWLNDESINGYFALMQGRCCETLFFNTHFYASLTGGGTKYDYAAVARWTKKWARGIFDFKRAVVPINRGNFHWCLVGVDLTSGHLSYYDSMKPADSYAHQVLATVERYLGDERASKASELDAPSVQWTHHIDPCPQQADGGSCGVFTCLFAKRFALCLPMDFAQPLVDRFRLKMAWDLVGLLSLGKGVGSKRAEALEASDSASFERGL
ncbi:Sentrin-specific protease 2 [Geranomyces variabilis]|uniref:Sentrin-specific protease 2 n=1 Tax=Geranomyces variabilis TaxID=109894 RepID=A0AAD5XLH5_9FUNG|nr:Sentrin-specific protease 2 [Geranomyces variabilis]